MAEGAIWGVPRSGLVFRRRGDQLVLIDRMPYQPEMPCTAKKLADYQEEDFQENRRHFEAAGVRVIDESASELSLPLRLRQKRNEREDVQ